MSGNPALGLGVRRELLQWQRLLPVNGDVLVTQGRRVRPQDVIAVALIPAQPFALSVPGLGDEEERGPRSRLLKQVGDKVSAGEPLAVKKGFLGREKVVCVSPDEGVVEAVSQTKGYVVLGQAARQVELVAGVAGTVVQVVQNRGAIVELSGLHGQGLAMAGDEAWGELVQGSEGPDGLVNIDSSHAGRVVFGGRAEDETIVRAASLGIRALVVGSTPASTWLNLLTSALKGTSVVIMEGVGTLPMGERTFGELLGAVGATALVSNHNTGARPAVVVSLEQEAYVERSLPQLEPGAQVRMASGPHSGRWGYVTSIAAVPRRTASGIVCAAAEVAFNDGAKVEVPVANLELVG